MKEKTMPELIRECKSPLELFKIIKDRMWTDCKTPVLDLQVAFERGLDGETICVNDFYEEDLEYVISMNSIGLTIYNYGLEEYKNSLISQDY